MSYYSAKYSATVTRLLSTERFQGVSKLQELTAHIDLLPRALKNLSFLPRLSTRSAFGWFKLEFFVGIILYHAANMATIKNSATSI
jgi:hypothetical protein